MNLRLIALGATATIFLAVPACTERGPKEASPAPRIDRRADAIQAAMVGIALLASRRRRRRREG